MDDKLDKIDWADVPIGHVGPLDTAETSQETVAEAVAEDKDAPVLSDDGESDMDLDDEGLCMKFMIVYVLYTFIFMSAKFDIESYVIFSTI